MYSVPNGPGCIALCLKRALSPGNGDSDGDIKVTSINNQSALYYSRKYKVSLNAEMQSFGLLLKGQSLLIQSSSGARISRLTQGPLMSSCKYFMTFQQLADDIIIVKLIVMSSCYEV